MIKLIVCLLRAQILARRTFTLLTVLAIALGVALGYAIHLINAAALADFLHAMKSVEGEPDAIIGARVTSGSVPLTWIDHLARDAAVQAITAVIDTRVRVDGRNHTSCRLIGVDFLSASSIMPQLLPSTDDSSPSGEILAGKVLVAPALLAKLGKSAGDELTLTRGDRQWQPQIAGPLPFAMARDDLLVADIAWVQEHFGPAEGVTEVRIRLTPKADPVNWRLALSRQLPRDLLLRTVDDDSARFSMASRAYRVNLNVLALVALLTGTFLVFATQLMAVAQRSKEFALLGILGLSPRMRLLQVLLAGLVNGIPGTVLGLGLGYLIAAAFTQWLGGDLGGGYFSGISPTLRVDWRSLLFFFALGSLASLAGALYPAVLNQRQTLAQALRSGFIHRRRAARGRFRWRMPALLLGMALLLAQLPPVAHLPIAGYLAIALLLAAVIALASPCTEALFSYCARLRLPPALLVAVQNVSQAPLLAQVAASGLIVSVALTASMVIMVASFRSAVDRWLDQVLPAPLYLRGKATPLPDGLLTALGAGDAPFLRSEASAQTSLTLDPQQPPVTVLVRDIDRNNPQARLPLIGPAVAVPAGQAVAWVSEPLRELYGVTPGQTLHIPLGAGEINVFIAGVWRDYARQFGALVISRQDFRHHDGLPPISELALWPLPGKQRQAREWLRPWLEGFALDLADVAEIRASSLATFDRSFAVTYALEAAALLIGLLSLATTLAASVGLRAHELAALSALGFSRRMLRRAITCEGVLIACIGVVLGLACGMAIGALLTHVINPQAFHWSMPLDVPWPTVAGGGMATLLAAALASHHAARQATRLPAAQVLTACQ